MPYKDPEKRREAQRKSKAKWRAAQKERKQEDQIALVDLADGMGDRPTVEDAEAAYGDASREMAISSKIAKRYSKSRTWAAIMYADSAPADWEDQLRMIGVAFAVSPLHNQDVTATGETKKPHWHVILDWRGGSTTYRTAEGITRGVLHGTIPIPLVSPRGYYRYFTHLDNPKKAQYDSKDIITGNGFDIGDFLELTNQEKAEIRFKLLELIIKEDMREYWQLITYAMYNLSPAELDHICTNTLFWQTSLTSKRYTEGCEIMKMRENVK